MEKSLSSSFDNFYSKVREILELARNRSYRAVNFEMVRAYWEIGRSIVEEEQEGDSRADYGSRLLLSLSRRLTADFGKGFDESNLRNMRTFYLKFQMRDALRHELSWTHYRILMRIEGESSREFYLKECVEGNWSTRQLERQINSLYYERILMTGRDNRHLLKKEVDERREVIQPAHIIKDPYVLEFLNISPNTGFYEKDIEKALIDKLQAFLLELGKGFSFVSRQYRISAEETHFYIDLVFYNYILKCFLLIDLKTGDLTHQDIGQMDFYVRYFEDQVRQKSDNPTIGLILCNEKSKTIVKYSLLCDSKQVFASKYKLYLPSEKELQEEISKERQKLDQKKQFSD